MGWDAIGAVGELLGALAVFATLLYLSIQVKEAARSAKFAAVQANRSERIDWFVWMRDSPYIVPIIEKANRDEPLSEEETRRLAGHLSANWALCYAEWVQAEMNAAGEYKTKLDAVMQWTVSSKADMAWWALFGAAIYPDGFVDYVNSIVPEESPAIRLSAALGTTSNKDP